MVLVLLLAVGAHGLQQNRANEPSLYRIAAANYRTGRTGDRERALREIRAWSPREIAAGVQAFRDDADHRQMALLPNGKMVHLPVRVDVPLVEAAALMHVEAGLLELQSLGLNRARPHFSAARSLVEWSHGLRAQRLRLLAQLQDMQGAGERDPVIWEVIDRALTIELKIEKRAFYTALAAATLALGFPEAASPFAEKEKAAAQDADALLVSACVKESLALQEKVRAREGEARRLLAEAEALFRQTLAADPARGEARLRLGGVLLAEGRPQEAEAELRRASEESKDERQRYLALLFLGRASELQERADDGAAFYRRALEASPGSQAARLALARSIEASEGPPAAHVLVTQGLLDSGTPAREPDPWWSYAFGPRGLAKIAMERLWQATLGRSFGS